MTYKCDTALPVGSVAVYFFSINLLRNYYKTVSCPITILTG